VESSTLSSETGCVDDDVPIHRIGGGSVENLSLKPAEATLVPPGIATFIGGSPAEAVETMRRHFREWLPKECPSSVPLLPAGFDRPVLTL
jgi:hypothetical protein